MFVHKLKCFIWILIFKINFDFVKNTKVQTIIYDGNHEATRKHRTFFDNLIKVTNQLNPLVTVVTETTGEFSNYAILPYTDLHKKNSIVQLLLSYISSVVKHNNNSSEELASAVNQSLSNFKAQISKNEKLGNTSSGGGKDSNQHSAI